MFFAFCVSIQCGAPPIGLVYDDDDEIMKVIMTMSRVCSATPVSLDYSPPIKALPWTAPGGEHDDDHDHDDKHEDDDGVGDCDMIITLSVRMTLKLDLLIRFDRSIQG